jgi:dephospho-CoA kinase
MRIAVTGGVCDGKTTILGFLSEMGYPAASADEIAAGVRGDKDVHDRISAEFGVPIFADDQKWREAIRGVIAGDESARRRLNSILHPAILSGLLSVMDSLGPGPVFAEVPLLVETAVFDRFDQVWVADAGEEARIARLTSRLGGNEAEARRFLRIQLPTRAKRPFGDHILRTNQPLPAVQLLIHNLAANLPAG